jgi:hypothetical protein
VPRRPPSLIRRVRLADHIAQQPPDRQTAPKQTNPTKCSARNIHPSIRAAHFVAKTRSAKIQKNFVKKRIITPGALKTAICKIALRI